MNHAGLWPLGLIVPALALGCDSNGAPPAASAVELSTAKAQRQDAAEKTAVAEKAKEKYAREMRKRLDDLEPKYAALRGRASEAEGRAKPDLDRKLAAVKVKRDAACRMLDALTDVGADGWQKAKVGFEAVLADLNAEFEKAP